MGLRRERDGGIRLRRAVRPCEDGEAGPLDGRTLESYANQFKGMDAATANIWGDAYGLSPETVLLLRQGADGIAKLKAEAHDVGAIIPPETVKRASEFKAQVVQITTMIRGMATTIALAALPAGGTAGSYVQRLDF